MNNRWIYLEKEWALEASMIKKNHIRKLPLSDIDKQDLLRLRKKYGYCYNLPAEQP